MTDLINIPAILILTAIFYILYLAYQTRNKFKTAIYNISASKKINNTEYHIVVEMKHGRFLDTRQLSALAYIFIPNTVSPLLKNTYSDYDSAKESLHELKNKYICR